MPGDESILLENNTEISHCKSIKSYLVVVEQGTSIICQGFHFLFMGHQAASRQGPFWVFKLNDHFFSLWNTITIMLGKTGFANY